MSALPAMQAAVGVIAAFRTGDAELFHGVLLEAAQDTEADVVQCLAVLASGLLEMAAEGAGSDPETLLQMMGQTLAAQPDP